MPLHRHARQTGGVVCSFSNYCISAELPTLFFVLLCFITLLCMLGTLWRIVLLYDILCCFCVTFWYFVLLYDILCCFGKFDVTLCCWHSTVGNSRAPFLQQVPRIGDYWGLVPHPLVNKVTLSLSLSITWKTLKKSRIAPLAVWYIVLPPKCYLSILLFSGQHFPPVIGVHWWCGGYTDDVNDNDDDNEE